MSYYIVDRPFANCIVVAGTDTGWAYHNHPDNQDTCKWNITETTLKGTYLIESVAHVGRYLKLDTSDGFIHLTSDATDGYAKWLLVPYADPAGLAGTMFYIRNSVLGDQVMAVAPNFDDRIYRQKQDVAANCHWVLIPQ